MYLFLSHKLDPEGLAWPGEPVIKVEQMTDVSEDCPFCSFISTLPNHFGTHMDAPRHFVKNGISINELPIEYFFHKKTALLEIPKSDAQGITREDLEPFADVLSQVSFALIRTGFEQYKFTEPERYQKEGPYIAPSAGIYLSENFPNLKGIGMDFLAIGSPSSKVPEGELPPDCHRNILGFYTGKFVTGIEDMHLSELPRDAEILNFINAPLRIEGLDSSQVVCMAEIKEI
ncbi:cyclase family protein [Anaerostipes sp.]|uniref:cyclase family protein n=1 Tax=Anaerostipes sp. TaxID=1872530 RepID=UPI0025C03B3C|nr:cyclase family protein [Anaerostipes sp.]MBS7006819.1 cyclase family protein [Anaerostipes sp.]